MERRLAAILAADVVGYSKLMGEDEAGTLSALRHLRRGPLAQSVELHNGNLLKSMGDGWLIEFSSAGDAVACAQSVQRALVNNPIFKLRIGVHLGDVSFEDEDVYGDGVNISARLQEIAQPGLVLISGDLFRLLDGTVASTFRNNGARRLKNIKKDIEVYSWPMEKSWRDENTERLLQGGKPRVFVAPFDAGSLDREKDLAISISNELSNALSNLTGFELVRDHGDADYSIGGTVRVLGDRSRISTFLSDELAGRQIWSDRLDLNIDDIFEIQDLCTYRTLMTVRTQVVSNEGKKVSFRDIDDLSVEETLNYAGLKFLTSTLASWNEIPALMESVLSRDPENFMAMGMWAGSMIAENNFGYKSCPPENVDRAFEYLKKAQEINSNSDFVYLCQSLLLSLYKEEYLQARFAAERALEISPNYSLAFNALSLAHTLSGNYQDGIDYVNKAIDADPRHPYLFAFYRRLGYANLGLGNYEEGKIAAQRAERLLPSTPQGTMLHIVLSYLYGQQDEAISLAEKLMSEEPNLTLHDVHTPPFKDLKLRAKFHDCLVKSGLPE